MPAALYVVKTKGHFSTHTKYIPVSTVAIDIQEYPSETAKNHIAYLDGSPVAHDDDADTSDADAEDDEDGEPV